MKSVVMFLLAIILGVVFMAGLYLINVLNNKPQLADKPSTFSIKTPPTKSINGKITSFSEGVRLQERDATEASKLKSQRSIQQGERIVTDDKGDVIIEFDNILTLDISSNTDLDIVQTLPENFVFAQTQGSVGYERIGDISISIRAMHLLIDQDPGNIKVDVDKENEIVTIDIMKGKITIAFNDLELKSKLLTLSDGKQLVFDDSKREIEINDF